MNSFEKYLKLRKNKNSILCVGIDPDFNKIPSSFGDGIKKIENYCKHIIDSTNDYTIAYKINFAFFEQFGPEGYYLIEKIKTYIPKDVLTIADAKRSDIGNTSKAYASSIYKYFKFDSITINPYMGLDSMQPFFEFKDKLNFVLALTSNPGANDFQKIKIADKYLYNIIIDKFIENFLPENLGFVIGATNSSDFENIATSVNDNVLLIPGVGTQGGDLKLLFKSLQNKNLLINVSRKIIYPEGNDSTKSITQMAVFYKNLLNENKN